MTMAAAELHWSGGTAVLESGKRPALGHLILLPQAQVYKRVPRWPSSWACCGIGGVFGSPLRSEEPLQM